MGYLNRLFGSNEAIAKDVKHKEEDLILHWNKYVATIPKKKERINSLNSRFDSNYKAYLVSLKELLTLEIVDIDEETYDERELIRDLESIEHSDIVKRLDRIDDMFEGYETRHLHVYHTLKELHDILKKEMHIVSRLLSGADDAERLVTLLKQQLSLELKIMDGVSSKKTFDKLLVDLVNKVVRIEQLMHSLDTKEKRMHKLMEQRMAQIFSDKIMEKITRDWTDTVFNKIRDKVDSYVEREGDAPPNIDFQIVNSPSFIEIVRDSIVHLRKDQFESELAQGSKVRLKQLETGLRKKEVSEQMINVFIHSFRQWFNQ